MREEELLSQGISTLCERYPLFKELLAGREAATQGLLLQYIDEIELFNPVYGLVGTADRKELVVKHLLDSLAPLGILLNLLEGEGKEWRPEQPSPASLAGGKDQSSAAQRAPIAPLTLADVGSGAGLPGIPLAICCPHWRITLIERMGRRAGFLQNTLAVLHLPSVRVEESDLERSRSGPFDIITFRAFHPLDAKLLKTMRERLTPGGLIAAYKGRREKITEEMVPLEKVSLAGNWQAIPVEVPFLAEERHLLIVR
ncbi:MAG: 16S rRNA (guanine(527)-N(7))-methyltransferase RsmG [Treponemataceae bacterium]|nr:16S rRNA (guanine(527)-N(7))-methyltransferase RsmG [Treponemataceae bacterium]